jgi:uncharacterized protein YfbU (UPF0304 family)
MELSKMDRLSLSFQLKILEKLYPEEADYYAQNRKAIEEGYALHYDWLFEHIYEGLNVEECKEVLDILDMYRAITFSIEDIEDKTDLDSPFIKFSGFDGNNESKQMAYTRYFIYDLDRYQELKYGKDYRDFNSHCPLLDKYRKMLVEWKKSRNPHQLSKETIMRIVNA